MSEGQGKPPGEQRVGKNNPPREHQFKPGQSGNPSGRPKGGVSVVASLKRVLLQEHADELNRLLIHGTIANLKDADKFDAGVRGYNTIADRADGKPRIVTETQVRMLEPMSTDPRNRAERAAAAAAMLRALGVPLPEELAAATEAPATLAEYEGDNDGDES